MLIPEVWQKVCCEYLAVHPAVMRRTWGAMTHSQWSLVTDCRHRMLLVPSATGPGLDCGIEPGEFVEVLEVLSKQRLLSHADSATMIDAILHRTTATGTWHLPTLTP